MSGMDRHKGSRHFASGAAKRKVSKERTEREAQELAKTRRMTEFFTRPSASEPDSASPSVQPEQAPAAETPASSSFGLSTVENDQNVETTDTASKQVLPESHTNTQVDDISLWSEHMTKEFIDYWAVKGAEDLHHNDVKSLDAKSAIQKGANNVIRKCTPATFERRNRNGEVVIRSWLCFSPANGRVYCFFCKLMGVARSQFTHDGFCDWKHASDRLGVHEQSKDHIQAVLSAASRAKKAGRVDSELAQEANRIEQYWRSVLKRLVSVLKFACERGLALRGDNETFGSPHNGNYLGILELLAEYDDFLKEHIQNHANRGSGYTNYLSSSICEELVRLMGNQVLNEIISRIKQSKYYSVSIDSTADEGHIDQLTLIFRYMEHDTPVERFVKFLPNQGHKAQEMFEGLMKFLADNDIDIQNCRGQSYDNASAMSGRYNGLQAKVAAENHHAVWIPCAGHSLNLVGQAAAECCQAAVAFFDFLEAIYVYFTASTHRYEILTDSLKTVKSGPVSVPKRVSTTRWSCRSEAVKALVQGYHPIREALAKITRDENEMSKARSEANGLHDRMCKLETGIYAVFWRDILDRVNATSHMLQDPKLDLNTAVAMLKSLKCFVREKRECFHVYEEKGKEMSGTEDYVQTRNRQRNVRLNPLDYGRSEEVTLSLSEKFRVQNFLPVIEQFLSSLEQRLEAYENTCSLFGFLRKLESLDCNEIVAAATKLIAKYKDDLDQTLGVELVQFAAFLTHFLEYEDDKNKIGREHFLYKLLMDKKVADTFPNVEIMLRMYLVLMVTNCSGERSFSKLKFIKNRLRTTMCHDRLSHLALMSIECDILREIDFDKLIQDFARAKSRKVPGGLISGL